MVSAFDSKSISPGLSPGQGHCIVFLGKHLVSLTQPKDKKGIENEICLVWKKWKSLVNQLNVIFLYDDIILYPGKNL